MIVTVNGALDDLPDGANVDTIVARLGRGRRGIAVAVNEAVVPRSLWSSVQLVDGDRVEVLTASQGG
jgi:thiamine biosynthesis protein ThiS